MDNNKLNEAKLREAYEDTVARAAKEGKAGERDTQTVKESAASTGEDTLQPKVSAPTVDIVWTTATGAVNRAAGPIALLSGEMQRFGRELDVWINELSKPNIMNRVAERIMFVARDDTGAVLANVQLFAELFGKRKVWESICRD